MLCRRRVSKYDDDNAGTAPCSKIELVNEALACIVDVAPETSGANHVNEQIDEEEDEEQQGDQDDGCIRPPIKAKGAPMDHACGSRRTKERGLLEGAAELPGS